MKNKNLFYTALIFAGCCGCTKTTVTLQNNCSSQAQDVWIGKPDTAAGMGDMDSLFFGDLAAGATSRTLESDFEGQSYLRFIVNGQAYNLEVDLAGYNDNCLAFDLSAAVACPLDSSE